MFWILVSTNTRSRIQLQSNIKTDASFLPGFFCRSHILCPVLFFPSYFFDTGLPSFQPSLPFTSFVLILLWLSYPPNRRPLPFLFLRFPRFSFCHLPVLSVWCGPLLPLLPYPLISIIRHVSSPDHHHFDFVNTSQTVSPVTIPCTLIPTLTFLWPFHRTSSLSTNHGHTSYSSWNIDYM